MLKNRNIIILVLIVFVLVAGLVFLELVKSYPVNLKIRTTGLNQNDIVTLYYEQAGQTYSVTGMEQGALLAFNIPLGIKSFQFNIDPASITTLYLNDIETSPQNLGATVKKVKQQLKLYFYLLSFIAGLVGAAGVIFIFKLAQSIKARFNNDSGHISKKRRQTFIYAVIFVAAFAITFLILKNDASFHLKIELNEPVAASGVLIYFVVPPYEIYVAPVENRMAEHDLPLAIDNLVLVQFEPNTQLSQRLLSTGTIHHALVKTIYLNGQPVNEENLTEKIQALQNDSRLWHTALVFAFIAGLLAALIAYLANLIYAKNGQKIARTIFKKYSDLINLINKPFFRTKTFRVLFLLLLCIIVVIWRKPGQIFDPFIIIEDGQFILKNYISMGWLGLFEPVNGYSILSSSILNFISFKISFYYYPYIAAFLANVFIILVIFAIAYSPTHLKKPYLCAILTLLVKTGSECFGVALYSFWWAGLLLILGVLWQTNKKPFLRYFFIIFGGLSSPIVLAAFPLMVFRTMFERTRQNIIATILALLPFLIQIAPIFAYQKTTSASSTFNFIDLISGSLRSFFGTYVNPWANGYYTLYFSGLIFIALMFYIGFNWRGKTAKDFIHNNLHYLLLLGWLAAAILSTAIRYAAMFIVVIHPYGYFEHRYFFYPYVLLAWIAVWIYATLPCSYPKILLKGLMLFMMFNFLFGGLLLKMPMEMPKLSWKLNVNDCIYGYSDNTMRIIANKDMLRYFHISAEDCRNLVENSIFFNTVQPDMRLNLKEQPGLY